MGRDRMRVLGCAVASIALIVAGALVMDWYQLSFDAGVAGRARIGIDLRAMHVCQLGQICVSAPLAPLPGMFPTLATVTMWSSLGVLGLVVFQAGVRILTGNASDAITKLGYMVSLMAISITVSAAYLFGLETEAPSFGVAMQLGVVLHRTWAPLTLIIGLIAGFATLYMAVAPESSDLRAEYKPVTLAPARAVSEARTRASSTRIPFPEHTGLIPILDRDLQPPSERTAAGSTPIPIPERAVAPAGATGTGMHLVRERPTTDLRRPATVPPRPATVLPRPATIPPRPATIPPREHTVMGVSPPRERAPTASPAVRERAPTGSPPLRAHTASGTQPIEPIERTVTGLAAPSRLPARPSSPILAPAPPAKTGPIAPVPDHLRNRLSYVALTAELTAGGIDARREDSSSRLVLWRDVVGVVVRRTPPVYDGTMFVDIVSTAGSTLRIVPWTRLTGDPIEAEGDARPRAVIERVLARCPIAKLDPATRHFLETGEAAQLPDVETLRAHDARLA